MSRKQLIHSLLTSLVVVSLLFAFHASATWTEPLSAPPTCGAGDPGCDVPLNVGTTNQTKTGGLLTVFDFWVDNNSGLDGFAAMKELAPADLPSASAGYGKLYVKDTDGNLYFLPDTAPEINISSPAGAGLWTDLGGGDIENTNTGNVGIGIAPTQKLHVTGGQIYVDGAGAGVHATVPGATALDSLQISDNADSSAGYLLWQQGSSRWRMGPSAGSPYDMNLVWGSGTGPGAPGASLLTVTTGGNVGIGTSGSPAAPLHVVYPEASNRYLRMESTNGNRTGLHIKSAAVDSYLTANAAEIGFFAGDGITRDMVIQHGGNVGIGTTSPGYELDVNGDVNATRLCIATDCRGSWTGAGLPAGSASQTLRHNGAGWVANSNLVNDGANVGIGIAPTQKLHVTGGQIYVDGAGAGVHATVPGATALDSLQISDNADSSAGYLLWQQGSSRWRMGPSAGSPYDMNLVWGSGTGPGAPGASLLTVTTGGNVGIGETTPQHLLTLSQSGNLAWEDASGTIRGWIGVPPATDDLTFNVGGADRITIDNSTGTVNIPGKLTVSTIDPVYEIDGKKYATYVADTAGGVTTETSGVWRITGSPKRIDFDELEPGGNLWLFWNTIVQDLQDVVVLLTPGFDGNVWYEKIEAENAILIHANQIGEVSFRLTAPREDAADWPNELEDE